MKVKLIVRVEGDQTDLNDLIDIINDTGYVESVEVTDYTDEPTVAKSDVRVQPPWNSDFYNLQPIPREQEETGHS